MHRYEDWLNQGKADLDAAMDSLKTKHYEWACFQAQQSGEKAAKALAERRGKKRIGHSISYLLEDLGVSKELVRYGRVLDRYYIPTRYPNGFDYGIPRDYFDESDAKEAIEYAKKIVEYVEREIA